MIRTLLWIGFALVLISSITVCQVPENGRLSQISEGEISGNIYHNKQLGFSYEFPTGWIVGKATAPEHKFMWKDNPAEQPLSNGASRCSKNLLFATEHPEGMRADGFVPMVSLFVVDSGCIPSATFPNSVGDREAVARIVHGIEARLGTPTLNNETLPRVRPLEYAGRVLLQISQWVSVSVHDTNTTTNENLQLSISVMQAQEYWVIWLFVTANDSEMSKLKATKLFFDDSPPSANSPAKQ